MIDRSFRQDIDGSLRLQVHAWSPLRPRAVLLVVHGMAEHGARYARLAKALDAENDI